MPALYDVPMPSWDRYEWLRIQHPEAVLPLPGEPVLLSGRGPGALIVRASDGKQQGFYHYATDTFDPDH